MNNNPALLLLQNRGQHYKSHGQFRRKCFGHRLDDFIGGCKRSVGHKVALQGNLDPAALYGSPQSIIDSTQAILEVFGQDPGHVFNLGHGIYPNIDPERVAILVETVHNFKGGF